MRGSAAWSPRSPTVSSVGRRPAPSRSTSMAAIAAGGSSRCKRSFPGRSPSSLRPLRPRQACSGASSGWARGSVVLSGSPAAGLAYRWRGIVVVQYAVPAEVIRREPHLDEAVRRSGFYAGSDQGPGILAYLADESGTLLIGEAPPEQLEGLML